MSHQHCNLFCLYLLIIIMYHLPFPLFYTPFPPPNCNNVQLINNYSYVCTVVEQQNDFFDKNNSIFMWLHITRCKHVAVTLMYIELLKTCSDIAIYSCILNNYTNSNVFTITCVHSYMIGFAKGVLDKYFRNMFLKFHFIIS